MQASWDKMLIESIQKYPFLYDKAYKDFRDVGKKNGAWNAIAREMGLESGDAANKRFLALRAQYTRNKRPSDPLMRAMSFLDPVVVKRKQNGHTVDDGNCISPVANLAFEDEILRPPPPFSVSSVTVDTFSQMSGEDTYLSTSPEHGFESSKRKKINFEESVASLGAAIAENLKKSCSQEQVGVDESFANFVWSRSNEILKKCTKGKKMGVRHRLLQFLDDLEMELD